MLFPLAWIEAMNSCLYIKDSFIFYVSEPPQSITRMSTAEKRSAEDAPEVVKKAKTAEADEENIEEEEDDDLDEEGEEGEGEDDGEDDGVS